MVMAVTLSLMPVTQPTCMARSAMMAIRMPMKDSDPKNEGHPLQYSDGWWWDGRGRSRGRNRGMMREL